MNIIEFEDRFVVVNANSKDTENMCGDRAFYSQEDALSFWKTYFDYDLDEKVMVITLKEFIEYKSIENYEKGYNREKYK